jgi:hypothetical protein
MPSLERLKKGVGTPSVRASGGELPSTSLEKCKNIPSYGQNFRKGYVVSFLLLDHVDDLPGRA